MSVWRDILVGLVVSCGIALSMVSVWMLGETNEARLLIMLAISLLVFLAFLLLRYRNNRRR